MMEIGGNLINFFDLTSTIADNKLHTTVYSKLTDCHLYLQAGYCHRKSSKKWYSQRCGFTAEKNMLDK